jgi:alpha-ribazole phosphatase
MDNAVVVALFRHGLTEENKNNAYIGWTDSPICKDSEELLIRNAFKDSPYELLITSDLTRCIQTAKALFPMQRTIKELPELREINFGVWEGKTYKELSGDIHYNEWVKTHCETDIPEGENYKDFSQRVEKGWSMIQEVMEESRSSRLAIVTHGGVIKHLLSKLANEELPFWNWRITHGNGYELVWSSTEAFRRGERCSLLREVLLTEKEHG